MMNRRERRLKRREMIQIYCMGNVKKYLQETTLHGLKYLADSNLTTKEKLFFFAAFLACFITVANLISNIYARWDSSPVIIGISPHPTAILKVPFPALTLCNMNQALYSKVVNYTENSKEYAVLKFLCYPDAEFDSELENSQEFQKNDLSISDFIVEHSQPCSRMLLSCQISSINYNCSELFREVLTDEGLCCTFNTLHPDFLYSGKYRIVKDLSGDKEYKAVNWNPEDGYPSNLPPKYYPRPTYGTGVSMGISLILNAELDEYYCSSSSGPGFKISLGNPIETPMVKDAGLIVPLGYETRFRIEPLRSEAMRDIRSVHRRRRQCVFLNEERLLYYKYYTKSNCENECQAAFLIRICGCVPYHLPLVYGNATICTAKSSFCIARAQRRFSRASTSTCLSRCETSCFELSFVGDALSGPLAKRNYTIQSRVLSAMAKDDVQSNIAVLHFYYRESVMHAELKNVYIGIPEFLSNTGGILGLFMGFSFISVAEIIYFAFLRPIFKFVIPRKYRKSANPLRPSGGSKENKNWLSGEISKAIPRRPRRPPPYPEAIESI